ncbi:hypothetical protein GW537_06570 [Piscirickettsia salmonis]|uniref:hypothetical protein n=1 Tax=Piscirickettsia salmonis TaxID=1238 RepID=UPI00137BDBBD|nr:hypothetical protein [Piscirickettsia salmonis]QHS28859.1 hypothetical protein GW537_06570 [Piscirickettsia salmonis]
MTDIVAALSGVILYCSCAGCYCLISSGFRFANDCNYIVMAALVAPVIQQLAEQAGMHVPLVRFIYCLLLWYFG